MRPADEQDDQPTRQARFELAEQINETARNENWWFVYVVHVDGTSKLWMMKPAKSDKGRAHLLRQCIALWEAMTGSVVHPWVKWWLGLVSSKKNF